MVNATASPEETFDMVKGKLLLSCHTKSVLSASTSMRMTLSRLPPASTLASSELDPGDAISMLLGKKARVNITTPRTAVATPRRYDLTSEDEALFALLLAGEAGGGDDILSPNPAHDPTPAPRHPPVGYHPQGSGDCPVEPSAHGASKPHPAEDFSEIPFPENFWNRLY